MKGRLSDVNEMQKVGTYKELKAYKIPPLDIEFICKDAWLEDSLEV